MSFRHANRGFGSSRGSLADAGLAVTETVMGAGVRTLGLANIFLGSGLDLASWNLGGVRSESAGKRFLEQRFSERFRTVSQVLFGRFGHAGVMDYVLVLPALLRFMCAGATRVNLVFGVIVSALLAPLRAVFGLVNFLASLALAALVTAGIHVCVKLHNNRIARRRNNSVSSSSEHSGVGYVDPAFQALRPAPNHSTSSMTPGQYEAMLAAEGNSGGVAVTAAVTPVGANPYGFHATPVATSSYSRPGDTASLAPTLPR